MKIIKGSGQTLVIGGCIVETHYTCDDNSCHVSFYGGEDWKDEPTPKLVQYPTPC